MEQGIQVQFWNGTGALPNSIYNVRVVVTDLDLYETDMKKALGDQFYFPVVGALRKIPGPFMVIIVAREFESDDPKKLKKIYAQIVGVPFPGFIANKGLTKAQLNPTRFEKLIDSLLERNDILDLILTWEEIFDKSKDDALIEITSNNVKTSVRSLVKILCKEFHENAGATREFVDEMTRLVSRRIGQREDFKKLVTKIESISKKIVKKKSTFLTKEDCLLLSKLIFFRPLESEEIMTGDIFETHERFKYGIILTPRCDIIQRKTQKLLVCYGFPLKKLYFRNKSYPPHKNDPTIIKLYEKQHSVKEIAKYIEKRYLKEPLPDSLPILWNFTKKEQGICLDFNNVQSVDKNEIKKWKRIARLDSPYIEEMLQRYGSLVSRIGTPEIIRSPSHLQNVVKKIQDKKTKTP